MTAVMRLRWLLLLLLLLPVVIVGLMSEVRRRGQEGSSIAENLVRRGSVICNSARLSFGWTDRVGLCGQRIRAQLSDCSLSLPQPLQHSSYFARVAKLIELGLNWLSLMNPRCRHCGPAGGGGAVEAAADSGGGPRGRQGSSLSPVECEKGREG